MDTADYLSEEIENPELEITSSEDKSENPDKQSYRSFSQTKKEELIAY